MSETEDSKEEPTEEQRLAIECRDLEILVEAGAGTGKTKTTIERYRRILGDGHEPGEILVFTFTDKAAAELRNRVRETDRDRQSISMGSAWIGTFHAVCSRILRSHPVAADIDPQFDVLSEVTSKRIRDEAFERALRTVSEDRRSAEYISRIYLPFWKSGITASYDQLRAQGREDPRLPAPSGDPAPESDPGFPAFARQLVDHLLASYGNEYSKMKDAAGVLDYEDLQLRTLRLLEANPGIRESYRDRFVEIMVDEFQDTNRLQLRLIRALQGENTTLFTVGDEMQAIYGFRYADVRLFRQRRAEMQRRPDLASPLRLTANFRSQAPVIGAVNLVGSGLDEQVTERRSEERRETDENPEPAEDGRQNFTDLRVGLNPEPGKPSRVELLFVDKEDWKPHDLGQLSPPEAAGQGPSAAATTAEALALALRISKAVDEGEVEAGEVAILFRTRGNMGIHAEALSQYGLDSYIVGRRDFWETREAVDLRSLLAVVANPLDDESLLSPLFGPACGLSSDAVLLLRNASGKEPLWSELVKTAEGSAVEGFPAADLERAREFVSAIQRVRASISTTPLGEVVEAVITDTGYDLACLARGRDAEGLANLRRVVSLAAEFEESEGRDLRGFLRWVADSSEIEAEGGVATQEETGDVVRLMTVHKAKGLEFDMVCIPDLGKQRNPPDPRICWLGPDRPDPGTEADSVSFGIRIKDEDGEYQDLYGWESIKEDASRDAEDEELRLFHVAMTRARRILMMSGTDSLKGDQAGAGDNTAKRLVSWVSPESPAERAELPESVMVPAPEAGVGIALDHPPEGSEIPVGEVPATEVEAEELRSGHATVTADARQAAGRPPLLRPESSRRPDVPLSFTTLSVLRDCPARFYALQVLKLDGPENRREVDPDEPGVQVTLDPEDQSPLTAIEATSFGNAVHEVLEACAKRRWVRPVDAEIESKLRQRGLDHTDENVLGRAKEMIYGFLDSPLGERVAGQRCDVEIPLLLDAGGITIRGFADLLAADSEPPLILDYKSNRLDGTTAEEKMDQQYGLQRDLYGLAVARSLGVESVDTAFVFLEAVDSPIEMTLGAEALESGQQEIDDLVAMIRTGSFFGEPGSRAKPCGRCWACERLESRTIKTAN